MARELKIKVKNESGEFELKDVPRLNDYEIQPNLSKKNGETIIRETREYELITPLFGGGAENKKADEVSVIRATEIRGHLRFWWRATRGGQFAKIEDLKKHEDAIFGSTEEHSALQIEVETNKRGQKFPPLIDHNNREQELSSFSYPLIYVSFPLRKERNAKIIEKIEFSVKFSYPSRFSNDIKASLWAWETFGGLGARTRRGFGAIQNKNYNPKDKTQIENDIKNNLVLHLAGNTWANDVPHLTTFSNARFKVLDAKNTVLEAWKHIIDKYKEFRQHRRPNPTRSRSSWSEPDEIRRLFLPRKYGKHSIPKTTARKFPRANFGLPIIFEFKDESLGDPLKTSLEGVSENQKRLASPLLFRPIRCSGNQFVGIAFILSGTRLPTSGVMLKDAPSNPRVQTDLTPTEASSGGLNNVLNGNPNVLEKFLSTL